MKLLLLASALIVCVGCGGKHSLVDPSPTPSAPLTPPVGATITLTGHVTATNGGQALAGVSVELGGIMAISDGSGTFRLERPIGGNARLLLSGAGIVPRSLMVAVGATRDVNIDAIDVTGFDLNFYRQLARNTFDAPEKMEPLRRWTRTPSFYLKTVDEAGEAIDTTTLATVERTISESVPQWTSGKLGVPVIERGTGTRIGESGWITVRFPAPFTEENSCGRAEIANDGGWLELYYTRQSSAATRCRLGSAVIAPIMIQHEVGHALGFFHIDGPIGVMSRALWSNPNQEISAREIAAAAVIYARPAGNTDPDVDPAGAVNLRRMSVR